MTMRRPVVILSLLCLLAAAGAAALLLANSRRDVTTSSAAAYQAYQRGFENENRFYKKEARVDYARAIQLDPGANSTCSFTQFCWNSAFSFTAARKPSARLAWRGSRESRSPRNRATSSLVAPNWTFWMQAGRSYSA